MKKKTKKTTEYPKYTKAELDEITAERKHWESYGKLTGARLLGWTYRSSAYFMPSSGYNSFHMNSNHCQMVDAALAKAKSKRSK